MRRNISERKVVHLDLSVISRCDEDAGMAKLMSTDGEINCH